MKWGSGGFYATLFSIFDVTRRIPPSVGGVKQAETGRRWVSYRPVFDVAGRIHPPGVGGVKRAETGWRWVSHRPVFDATRTSRIKG